MGININQKAVVHLISILAVISVLVFLLVSTTFDFPDKIFSTLFSTPSFKAAATSFTYYLTSPGNVSVAVYDSTGKQVRTLQSSLKQDSGQYSLSWDGLDRNGSSLPAGEYEWRLLQTPGFQREWQVTVGKTAVDSWPGNHTGPTGVMVDDNKDVYLSAGGSEGPDFLRKQTPDGQRIWGQAGDAFSGKYLQSARIGNLIYQLYEGLNVHITDADTGSVYVGISASYSAQGIPVANVMHPNETGDTYEPWPGIWKNICMAAGKDYLVFSYRKFNELRFYKPGPDGGALVLQKSISLPSPTGVTVASDGRLFAISGTRIVQVDPQTGAITTIINDPSLSPMRLTHDPVNDDLIVLEQGDNISHIRRYHLPDASLVAVYGRPEGRTFGQFNPLDFGELKDIAADRMGGFYAVEEVPRRVTHFSGRQPNSLAMQWFGGMYWSMQVSIDKDDPTQALLWPDAIHLGLAKIDYPSHSWTLTYLFGNDEFATYSGYGWSFKHQGGNTYIIYNGYLGGGDIRVYQIKGERLVPVATLATGNQGGQPYAWTDLNQNEQMDASEIKRPPQTNPEPAGLQHYVDKDWNIWRSGDWWATTSTGELAAWTMIPNEGALGGLPVWDWNHWQVSQAGVPAREEALLNIAGGSIYHDKEGNTYESGNGVVNGDTSGMNWPHRLVSNSRFMKWNAQGEHEWSVGVHAEYGENAWGLTPAAPGSFAQLRTILGEVKDCIIIQDAVNAATAYTKDGLYVGSFEAPLVPGSYDPGGFFSDDNQYGDVVETPSGDVLIGSGTDGSTPYFKITGWDGWQRQSGKITLGAASVGAQWAGDGLRGEYFNNRDLSGTPAMTRIDPAIWFGAMRTTGVEGPTLEGWFPNGDSAGLDPAKMSVRWTGFIEAPVSEVFQFPVYTWLGDDDGSRVRLWIDGKLVLNEWDNIPRTDTPNPDWGRDTTVYYSNPLLLEAGTRVPIKLEYSAAGFTRPQLNLYWKSNSFDPRHVPHELLYTRSNSTPNPTPTATPTPSPSSTPSSSPTSSPTPTPAPSGTPLATSGNLTVTNSSSSPSPSSSPGKTGDINGDNPVNIFELS